MITHKMVLEASPPVDPKLHACGQAKTNQPTSRSAYLGEQTVGLKQIQVTYARSRTAVTVGRMRSPARERLPGGGERHYRVSRLRQSRGAISLEILRK